MWVKILKAKSQSQQALLDVVNLIETQIVTTRNTPQNNGTAERMNRTLVEKSRTLIIDSGLPKNLWAEMIVAASFLYNRNQHTCPYEKMWGKKPKLASIRPIGSELLYSIHHFEQLGKLDTRCRRGVLVGFDEGIHLYRVWDSDKGKVIRSRDVTFRKGTGASP